MAVYAERESGDLFRLMLITTVSARKSTETWPNMKSNNQYKVGNIGEIKWENIVRPFCHLKTIYGVDMIIQNGVYELTQEALPSFVQLVLLNQRLFNYY